MIASLWTSRLLIVPLTLPQLQLCLTDLPALEMELGLSISRDVFTKRVQRAIRMKRKRMRGSDVSQHPWQTYWLVVISEDKFGAGLAGFKGVPSENGSTEIGYGIDPAYQNRGYTSEAVRALVDWAFQHPFCIAVTATTVENPASRRLLENLGAHLIAEDNTSTSWEFVK
ncbi:MAG: GNAT family N-acetyltransferase [Anaerolineales bacterium]|jgi:RimJ/RimL family protein N-acetyltransferase